MVSRRRILSRSRDDLNIYHSFVHEDEEDVWYQKEKLFREHIQEVLDKWNQIDDEIWAKIIVFERNRRVAKAYARTPILTVNGSDDGFDGMKIGLCGFENPMRDRKIEEIKRNVGQGVKLRMDDDGNISVRRYSKSNVYVKSTASSPNEDTSIGNDILKLPSNCLELEKIAKIFDMKKFQANINRELRRSYPDRKKLETQCLSAIAFGRMEVDILDCPVWVLIVNVVAMDMLKCKIPPIQRPFDISNRPKISLPDEDPYTVLENGEESSGSASSGFGTSAASSGYVISPRDKSMMQAQYVRRNERPPKLPPRDNFYAHNLPKPDYDDFDDENRLRGRANKSRDNVQKYDDPYYCGLRARVCIPKTKVRRTLSNDDSSLYSSGSFFQKPKTKEEMLQERFRRNMEAPAPFSSLNQLHLMQYSNNNNNDIYSQPQSTSYIPRSNMMKQQRYMWHRSFESGIDIEVTENPYGPIYGRLPLPPPRRRYLSSGPTTMYVGEWE